MDPLSASMKIAASGLAAQSARLRVVSENLANAHSTGKTPGSEPYRRKTLSFTSEVDRVAGLTTVKADSFGVDTSPFSVEYDPSNPAADGKGEVKVPNVNMLVELADMREANRAYEADIQVMKQTRELVSMTVDLLKGVG